MNEIIDEFKFIVAEDGKKIYYQAFIPNDSTEGILIVFQGLGGGGKEDFQLFSKELLTQKFLVVIVHQRGTGYSEGVRGDIECFEIIINDSKTLISEIANQYLDKPIFILGHSLGGTISIRLAADLKNELSGVILLNPMTRLEYKSVTFSTKLKFVFNYLFRPSFLTVQSVNSDQLQHPLDKSELKKKENDPLVVQKHSMRYMFESKKLIDASIKNAKNANVPLLLIFGAKDEVVDHSGSEKVYENWNNSDRAKIIIENGGHGAHTIDLVLKETIKWLENQLLINSKKEEKL